jgi:hypothetical protein
MNAIVKHIGLQVVEKDVKNFYIDIIGCKILSTRFLSKEDAGLIFNIPNEVKILYTACAKVDMELFVTDSPKPATFSHLCIHANCASEIADKALQSGYRVYVRKKENTETYFISDSNFNVFEIKKMGDL